MKIKKELPSPKELRDMREERGQAQDDAARSIDYKVKSWYQWEKGVREMPRAAWALYQLGGIDAILSGEAFTPAKPAPATAPAGLEDKLWQHILQKTPKPRNLAKVVKKLYGADQKSSFIDGHRMADCGYDEENSIVRWDYTADDIVFTNPRVGLYKTNPIYHLLTMHSEEDERIILTRLFGLRVPMETLDESEKELRSHLFSEAKRAEHDPELRGKVSRKVIEHILENAHLQPYLASQLPPLPEGVTEEDVWYDEYGRVHYPDPNDPTNGLRQEDINRELEKAREEGLLDF